MNIDAEFKIKEYCYILDYSDSTVCVIEITEEDFNLESEELLEKYGCNIDTCEYMYSTNKIDNIIKLNPIEKCLE